jgi:hypothetical protein
MIYLLNWDLCEKCHFRAMYPPLESFKTRFLETYSGTILAFSPFPGGPPGFLTKNR